MSEPDFDGLRTLLEESLRKPDFSQVRQRRTSRSQRFAVGAVAIAVVAAAIGGGLVVNAIWAHGEGGRVVPPTQTPTAWPTATAAPTDSGVPTSPPASSVFEVVPIVRTLVSGRTVLALVQQCCGPATTVPTTRVVATDNLGRPRRPPTFCVGRDRSISPLVAIVCIVTR